jgi:hypothetical protein
MGRPPEGKHAMSGAQRQARYLARLRDGLVMPKPVAPAPTHADTVRSACDINWENHQEDDSESDAVIRARAVQWQLFEAVRLAEEFALRRPGTQPSEIKPVLDRKICKVITAWEKLRKEMRSKHDRAY